jgi:hypothetical protein
MVVCNYYGVFIKQIGQTPVVLIGAGTKIIDQTHHNSLIVAAPNFIAGVGWCVA